MNKLHLTCSLLSLATLWCVVAPAKVEGQVTVFQTGFEYEDEPIVFEPVDLNGAIDQVGLWSGIEFPIGAGELAPDAVGFVDNPYGGRGYFMDRPQGDDGSGIRPNVEENGDFTGSLFADLDDSVLLLGAQVSFDVATRRGSGNDNKSWDIIGRDTNGMASFHLRVSTNNSLFRLGTVTEGDTFNTDLATTDGDDRNDDIPNIGASADWTTESAIGSVSVLMGAEGYVIDFAHHPERTNGNAYTTEVIPYNGEPSDLAQVEFTYEASAANGRNSGIFLDNVLVIGNKELLAGDFNNDGQVDLADLSVLATNFNQPGDLSAGDINFDGRVDLHDFFEWRQVFQPAGAAASVPEPRTGGLLVLALVLSLWGRRKSRRHKLER